MALPLFFHGWSWRAEVAHSTLGRRSSQRCTESRRLLRPLDHIKSLTRFASATWRAPKSPYQEHRKREDFTLVFVTRLSQSRAVIHIISKATVAPFQGVISVCVTLLNLPHDCTSLHDSELNYLTEGKTECLCVRRKRGLHL